MGVLKFFENGNPQVMDVSKLRAQKKVAQHLPKQVVLLGKKSLGLCQDQENAMARKAIKFSQCVKCVKKSQNDQALQKVREVCQKPQKARKVLKGKKLNNVLKGIVSGRQVRG